MTPSAILETALYVNDLDAAEVFYRDVLGLELVARTGMRQVFFRCGGGMLLIFDPNETEKPPGELSRPVPPHGVRGEGHMCFRADSAEIDRWVVHLKEADVEIEADFHWPNGGRSIYFRDPAGNSLEFAEPIIWGLT